MTSKIRKAAHPIESDDERYITYYAAIDATNGTHAVYGTGYMPDEAVANALRGRRFGDPGDYVGVPCTIAAAAYVGKHGGQPSTALTVSRDGVCLRSEEE